MRTVRISAVSKSAWSLIVAVALMPTLLLPADGWSQELDGEATEEAAAPSVMGFLSQAEVLNELQLNAGQRRDVARLISAHQDFVEQLESETTAALQGITSLGERLRKRATLIGDQRQKTTASVASTEQQLLEVLNDAQRAALQAKVASDDQLAADAPPAGGQDDEERVERATPAARSRPATRTAETVASFGEESSPADQGLTDPGKPVRPGQISFNFHEAPWTDVLRLFAEAADLTLNLKDVPPGRFTYYDRQQYTPVEALDIMNRFLLQEGHILVQHDRFLSVFNTKDGVPPNLVETVSPEQLASRGSTELLRVALPLGEREGEQAAEEIRGLLGPQGSVVPLDSAGSVVVTDIAANLRRIKDLLEPPPRVEEGDLVFRPFKLEHIDAPSAADIVRGLLGLQSGVQNVSEANSRRSSSSRSSSRDPREFWRQRFGGGSERGGGESSRGQSSSAAQQQASQSKAQVATDLRTNMLLVTATAAEMKLVDEIVESIDVSPRDAMAGTPGESIEPYLHVYTLKTANPTEVSKTLSVLHPGMVVNEDGQAKRVHIWATAEQHREIGMHIRQLDGAAAGESLAIVTLPGLSSYDVSNSLTALYANDPASAPSLQVDPSGRGLIVRGDAVQIAQIQRLVAQMAEAGPADVQRTVQVVPINAGSSDLLQSTIGALYPQVTFGPADEEAEGSNGRSSDSRGRGGRSESGERSREDADRAERIRRWMEMRARFFGGGRDGGDRGGRGRGDRGSSSSSRGGR